MIFPGNREAVDLKSDRLLASIIKRKIVDHLQSARAGNDKGDAGSHDNILRDEESVILIHDVDRLRLATPANARHALTIHSSR